MFHKIIDDQNISKIVYDFLDGEVKLKELK